MKPAIPLQYETCGCQHDNCPGHISGTCTQPAGHSGSHTCSVCGMRF
ncbi:MAG: hypothetical protein SF066_00130 [Thermoanaerobaculia bacterium]|nr:hypothetical protein [Thermoanaerobaculia bacterium]